ncbi:MAG: phosphoribosylglycinamide formyltransferase 2, partial [Cyanobacteria bacterium P01_G01_bin.19]
VAQALEVEDTDIKLFGKPDSRPYRRMGVALAKGETTAEAREKATNAANTVTISS